MNKLNLFFLIFIVLGLSMPILSIDTLMVFIAIVLLILFNFKKVKKRLFFLCLLWSIYSLMLYFLNFSNSTIGNIFDDICFFLIPLLLIFYKGSNSKIIILSIDIILVLNFIYNSIILIVLPGILDTMNYIDLDYDKLNFSGTSFVMHASIYAIIKLYDFSNLNMKNIVFISIALIYVFLSGKATFVILSSLVLLHVIVKSFKIKPLKSLMIISMFILLFSLFTVKIPVNERLLNRLEATSQIDTDSVYFERFNLINLSFQTFLKNPLVGVGYDKEDINGDINIAYKIGIGMHSELVDFLPRYGLIGVLFLLLFIKLIKKQITFTNYKYIFSLFFMLSIFSNTFTITSSILLFIYFPLLKNEEVEFFSKKNIYLTKKNFGINTKIKN